MTQCDRTILPTVPPGGFLIASSSATTSTHDRLMQAARIETHRTIQGEKKVPALPYLFRRSKHFSSTMKLSKDCNVGTTRVV